MGFILLVFLVFILLIIVTSCIKIVPQEHAYILERLGTYMDTWPAGLHFYRQDRAQGQSQGAGRGFPAPARYYQG